LDWLDVTVRVGVSVGVAVAVGVNVGVDVKLAVSVDERVERCELDDVTVDDMVWVLVTVPDKLDEELRV